jgi:sugar phosphate isomerase/epimerase
MRYGICADEQRFETVRDAGADYVEPSVVSFADPEGPETAWRERLARLRDLGIPADAFNCFLPGDLKFIGPDGDRARFTEYARTAIARLHEAGASVLVFGSGAARSAPPEYAKGTARDEFSDAVELVAAMAQPAGITVAIESLPERETNVANSIGEAGIIALAISRPNVGTCADLWHISGESADFHNMSLVGATIEHAHVADSGRRPPGTGTIDTSGFFEALAAGGYDGRVSIEGEWDHFDAQAAPALDFLKQKWADARKEAGK